MIRLAGVTRTLGSTPALRGVDLRVASGERVAVVGPSGAGKTTLFRVINLSLRPDGGTYQLDDRNTSDLRGADLRAARTRIATIHQQHDVVGRMSVLRNVLAGRLGVWGWRHASRTWIAPSQADVEAAHSVCARVGIADKLFQRADRLSGGQQQRVAIARALFQDARLVLADEPVASVDPMLAEEIVALLVRSATEDGRTLLVNLHQPDLVRRHFARVVGLRDGCVAFDLPTERVDDALLAAFFTRREADDASGGAPQPAAGPECRPLGS
ncbi:MAG: ATP-binding cassette domain-containing protein [Planctomycetes bacterium]|nr:ATP-binding cassette domain-containing protein [Planctomycetota bacterium]